MKRLFVLTTIIAASLIATSAYSQVYVNAHVRLPFPPVPHISIGLPVPPPVVVQSAPVYQQAYPGPAAVACDYPDAAYYTYPSWNGHYRDRVYYDHYRPYYERDYRVVYQRSRNDRAYDHRGYDRNGDHRRGW